MTRSSSSSRMRPSRGPGGEPELRDEVVAVDGEPAPIEDDVARELGRDPCPELLDPPGVGRQTAEPTLSATRKREQLIERASPKAAILPMNRRTAASDQFGFVAEHVLRGPGRRRGRGRRAARGAGRGAPRPASRRPLSWPMKWPSARVDGLPMSWSSAASRTTGAISGRRVDRPKGVVPEVLARDLVLGDAALRGQLRRDRREQARVGHAAAARPTGPAPRAASRARPRSARPRGGRRASARAWIAGQRRRLDRRTRASRRAGPRGSSAGRPPRTAPAGRRRRAGSARPTSAEPSYGIEERAAVRPAARPRPSR